jgi:hypothetical protein
LFEKTAIKVEVPAINCGIKAIIPPFILVNYLERACGWVKSDDLFVGFVAFIVIEFFFVSKD